MRISVVSKLSIYWISRLRNYWINIWKMLKEEGNGMSQSWWQMRKYFWDRVITATPWMFQSEGSVFFSCFRDSASIGALYPYVIVSLSFIKNTRKMSHTDSSSSSGTMMPYFCIVHSSLWGRYLTWSAGEGSLCFPLVFPTQQSFLILDNASANIFPRLKTRPSRR